ncbi:MAG: response regulator [Myxococcales bacterium]|nr:response regulator [Myxococcales bacterium]
MSGRAPHLAPAPAPVEVERNGALVWAVGLILFGTGIVFTAAYTALDEERAAWVCLVSTVLAVFILAALRRSGERARAARRLVRTYWIALTGVALFTGGHFAPVMLWMATVPMLATLMSGLPSGRRWSALVIVELTVFFILDAVGVRVDTAITASTYSGLVWFGNVTLVCLVMVITWRYDVASRRALARLEISLAALRDARDRAQAASVAKSRFLANMSHEIRTPMNGVLGTVDLLLAGRLEAEHRELVETVRTSAEALLGIINDILDFSRIEAGRVQLEQVAFDPEVEVGRVLSLLQPRASEAGVELLVHLDPRVPARLLGDPGRIAQVVTNLVGNALKFTRAGQVDVRLTVEAQADGAALLRCAVVDTGPGIPEDVQASLFEPFVQADTSTTRLYGGTGLGLAICHELVEAMGGAIGVQSRVGEGSTFWFCVPLTGAGEAAPRGPRLDGHRLLVVDDHLEARQRTARLLADAGAAVAEASSAPEALAMWRDAAAGGRPFTRVVTDTEMPGWDGAWLARALRSEAGGHALPIVALGAPSAGEGEIDVWVRKPAMPGCLLQRVALARRAEGQVPTPTPATFASRNALRVLVVEDNPTNQKVVRRMLDRLGHEVTMAGNGVEALAAIDRRSFDLVLMDSQMPVMDGVQATQAIRGRDGPERGLPIVAMTAHAMKGDRERYLAAGMDAYVSKPVSLQTLAETLAPWANASPVPLDPAALDALGEGHGQAVVDAWREAALDLLADVERDLRAVGRATRSLRRLWGAASWVGAQSVVDACAELDARGASEGGAEIVARLRAAVEDAVAAAGGAPEAGPTDDDAPDEELPLIAAG